MLNNNLINNQSIDRRTIKAEQRFVFASIINQSVSRMIHRSTQHLNHTKGYMLANITSFFIWYVHFSRGLRWWNLNLLLWYFSPYFSPASRWSRTFYRKNCQRRRNALAMTATEMSSRRPPFSSSHPHTADQCKKQNWHEWPTLWCSYRVCIGLSWKTPPVGRL